jgi:hypothetical protein
LEAMPACTSIVDTFCKRVLLFNWFSCNCALCK